METKSNTSDNTLWSRTFITVAAANFLLFFSFYQLLPILPLYIIDKFQTDNATAGFIISLYTIGALACRPFAGFLVDTFSRKPLYFWTFFAFTLCFLGYKTVGLLPILAVVRFAHGLFFGISSTASNTVAIDALPASRRGEGIGYFGISVNLAFATGPMTGMFLYEAFGDGIVFAISTILCVIGLVLVPPRFRLTDFSSRAPFRNLQTSSSSDLRTARSRTTSPFTLMNLVSAARAGFTHLSLRASS